jgi:methyl-accepting chemotaxis protein PixJ
MADREDIFKKSWNNSQFAINNWQLVSGNYHISISIITLFGITSFEVRTMTNVYQNGQENGHNSTDKEQLVNSNTSVNKFALPSSNEISSELNAVQQHFKSWRRQLQDITSQMRQAQNFDALTQATTVAVREKIACDRVFIYRFNSADSGVVIAESRTISWTPVFGENLPVITFGLATQKEYLEPIAINDITQVELTPYQLQLWEKYQIKANLILPIFLENQVWGLLAINNCITSRQWHEVEVSLLSQITAELTYRLQGFEFQRQQQEQEFKHKSVTKVIEKIQRASNLDKIFQTTTQEVRQLLKCDRVGVYRFNPDWSGEFIAESVGDGWVQVVGPDIKTIWQDTHLQENQGGRYRYNETFVVNDIYQVGHATCHIEILEQFQVKAYVIVPVFSGQKLWGLLAAYQNSGTRDWQNWEVKLLNQFGVNFGVAVSQAENLEQVRVKSEELTQLSEQEKAVTKVVNRIRQSLDIDDIFKATTLEVRQLLQCDRVSVYRFNTDWSGLYVAESVAVGWTRLVGLDIKTVWEDTHLQETEGGRYAKGEIFVVNNIYKVGHSPCHVDLLEQFEVKAYVIVPVFSGKRLWGLLAAYQNSGTRNWQATEVSLVNQIGVQLGVAVSQAEFLQQAQEQSQKLARTAERQQSLIALTRKIGEALIEKVTDSSQFDTILQTTVAEVRKLLQADRTVVYRFNPDWTGEFVAESFSKGWLSFRQQKFDQAILQENGHCDTIRNLESIYQAQDTYLQDNKGGRYQQKTTFVVNDIYKANFPECYMQLLELFEAKAYLTVPIYKENKLWGLLASYQHSGPRDWEEIEVSIMNQIAVLLGVAMQQAETVEKLQQQSQELAKTAERDRAAAKVIEKIRQSLDIDTIFNITTKEVRSLLTADRVAVYRFNSDWGGLFVSESVSIGWASLLDKQDKIDRLQASVSVCNTMRNLIASSKTDTSSKADTYMQATKGGKLGDRKSYVVKDIHKAGFSDCYLEVLEEYQCKSYAIVPIFQGQHLWGMLAAYQNSAPRAWEEAEVTLLTRLGDQLGVALQQAEYLQQLQSQSAKLAEAATREKAAKEVLQKGVMKLLGAVRPALNGDLTVRAPITEDEIGTVADAYNNTLQALRQIVIQVQGAAQQVAETSNDSNAALGGLTNLARQQYKEISEALGEIQEMVNSTQAVAANAELVQVAVQKANQTVESGDAAMNLTVEAIQGIRKTVAQTSKKIKRLSESSQKISKVVNLISNFATQTNVLALNAAIEATRAGEYGKGFAVVADEVRSLSRQSAAATIEIEKLVQEIQSETGEVAVAMETGIQQVVEGTQFVNQTRQNLNAIVAATAEISNLLQQITEANQGQMSQSVSVTTSMKDVAKIANKTSAEANNIAAVFQQLSGMAQELLASASKFKVK